MDGKELKKKLKDLEIKSRDVAAEIGVTEQAMTSFYKTSGIRQSTLDRIDRAVRKITNGEHSIFEDKVTPVPEPSPKHTDTAPMEKQMDALAYLTASVTNLAGTLSDALARLNIKEKEIDERIERLDSMLRLMSANVTLYDVAAESSHSSNEKTTATT